MAIVLKDGERLYLTAWEYNAARVMTELAKIVDNHGGRVKPTKTAIISNRAVTTAIKEIQADIERINSAIERMGDNERRTAALQQHLQQLEKFENINNDPITVTHTSYITFILDDVHYYYQVDSNPFFPFYYQKTPIKGGKYSRDASIVEDKKEWLYDCFFGSECSNADVKEAANLIFNMLCNAANTPIMRDKHKQRVPNTYDDGYHMETVYAPERFEKIDF
jgi:hypothetical protein